MKGDIFEHPDVFKVESCVSSDGGRVERSLSFRVGRGWAGSFEVIVTRNELLKALAVLDEDVIPVSCQRFDHLKYFTDAAGNSVYVGDIVAMPHDNRMKLAKVIDIQDFFAVVDFQGIDTHVDFSAVVLAKHGQ